MTLGPGQRDAGRFIIEPGLERLFVDLEQQIVERVGLVGRGPNFGRRLADLGCRDAVQPDGAEATGVADRRHHRGLGKTTAETAQRNWMFDAENLTNARLDHDVFPLFCGGTILVVVRRPAITLGMRALLRHGRA